MMRWTERLFDPYAAGEGPPPERLWPFMAWLVAGTRPAMVLGASLSIVIGLSEAVGAFLIGWIIDRAAVGPETFFDEHGLALLLAAGFFLILRPGLMVVSGGVLSRGLGPGLFHLGVWRLHRHTLGQSLRYFEDDFTGRLAQKQIQTATSLTDIVVELVNSIGFAIAAVIGALVALSSADWRLACLMLLWIAGYCALIAFFLPQVRQRSRRRAEARAGLSGQLVDSLSHMATVKLFAHAGREEEAARGALGRFREAALAFGRTVQAFRGSLAVLGGVLPVMLVGTAIWLWSAGEAGPGAIAMAGFLAMRISQMSGWISFTTMSAFANLGTVEDGMRTLSPPHEIVDAPEAEARGRAEGAIAFETVVFHYGRDEPEDADGGEWAEERLGRESDEAGIVGMEPGGGLEGFSLSLQPGEKVALVGRSGAGKSTALSLLLRLYDVEGGRITLDGVDVRDLPQDHLRRQIAMVTQETAMFNRSALDNILYGRPSAGREAAIAAAEDAAAHDFIMELRDHKGREAYEAHLGERGVKLSGGQRQRIAIARAILKDAPILALDEATAALDSETEAAVQAALRRLMEGRTVIAIAHRLSTIAHMDRIVVMDAGRVVEEGSHAELLARGGLYAGFWQRQSGGFIGIEAAE